VHFFTEVLGVKTLLRTFLPRVVVAGAVLTAAVAVAPAASAAPAAVPHTTTSATVNYACQADTPIGEKTFDLSATTSVTAPDTVAPGAGLTVSVAGASATVPTSEDGITVNSLSDLALKVPVPANSTYVSTSLSGGSGNLGATGATESGGVLTVTAAGPVTGGSVLTLPTASVNLTAGASGTIQTTPGGTSYTDPGLTATASVSVLFVKTTVSVACYPSPTTTLTTTTIG
jgi:dehydratase